MEKKLSVVLPCYNEAENLPALFQRLDALKASLPELEIVLVDNGSKDHSREVITAELLKRPDAFRLVTIQDNRGYGFGILSGLRSCNTGVLSWTHADIQTDPMDIATAWKIFRDADSDTVLVKGRRVNRKFGEWFFSSGMALLATVVLGKNLKEINAQPKMFSKSFFDEIEKAAPEDFSLDLYFQYCALKRGKTISFPVNFSPRTAGEAKGGSGSSWKTRYKLIRRSVAYIFALRGIVR